MIAKKIALFCFGIASVAGLGAQPAPHIAGKEALERLKAGNQRYVAGQFDVAGIGPAARAAVANAQHPFATVLTCADSRVPPEAIFGQGLGDLFVVRVAGAVPDQAVLASIEYAAEHLEAPLVVVMGHISCGAVKAAMASAAAPRDKPDPLQINMERLLVPLRLSLRRAKPQGDSWANAVEASVDQNLDDAVRLSPALAEFLKKGKVVLVGAVYDLNTGKVAFKTPVGGDHH